MNKVIKLLRDTNRDHVTLPATAPPHHPPSSPRCPLPRTRRHPTCPKSHRHKSWAPKLRRTRRTRLIDTSANFPPADGATTPFHGRKGTSTTTLQPQQHQANVNDPTIWAFGPCHQESVMGNSKNTSSRRVSSTLSKVSTPPSTARTPKASKPSKVIQLKLTSALLAEFPHEKIARKPSQTKSSSTSTVTPAVSNDKVTLAEVKSETKTSPAPSAPEIPPIPAVDMSQKGSSGPKTSVKRELGEGVDDGAKSKSRPGPKKRQKLDNGIVDGNPTIKAASGAASVPTHKLGPKANQGAINAGLRALDRTGTPCRKWAKKGFCIKTFTGVTWQIQSWRAPKTKKFNSEGDAGAPSLPTSNSQSKENNSSSNVGSEKSRGGPNDSTNLPSSPFPAIAVPA
ncbi:hypothetical protein MMC22_007219 [Lobaria immixta]|nr:hypothetical protein [Lobaria immixta]